MKPAPVSTCKRRGLVSNQSSGTAEMFWLLTVTTWCWDSSAEDRLNGILKTILSTYFCQCGHGWESKICWFDRELFTLVDCRINHSNHLQIWNKTSAYLKEWIEQGRFWKQLYTQENINMKTKEFIHFVKKTKCQCKMELLHWFQLMMWPALGRNQQW